MELTAKGIAALVIPAIITIAGTQVDGALKWRAELEQREYDRQMKILDKIINTENPDQRIAVAKFYLNAGTFNGLYRTELEASIMFAEEERKQIEELRRVQEEEQQRHLELSSRLSVAEPAADEEVFDELEPVPMEAPAPEPMEPPREIPIQQYEIPSIGPRTIFSYDKQALQ